MCSLCCGGTPVEKRGSGHATCSVECYNAVPTRRRTSVRKQAGNVIGFTVGVMLGVLMIVKRP
jgi:hypothetical protein